MDRDALGHEIGQVLRKYGLGGAVVLYRDDTSLVTSVIASNPVEYAALRVIGEVCVAATDLSRGAVNKAMVGVVEKVRKITSVN